MKPSEFRPDLWDTGKDRRTIIGGLRRQPPTGLNVRFNNPRWQQPARRELLIAQNGKCAACHLAFRTTDLDLQRSAFDDFAPRIELDFEIDHVVPLSRDGDHSMANLQLLCRACHQTKTSSEQTDPQRREERRNEWERKERLRTTLANELTSTPIRARDLAATCNVTTSTATGHLVELQRRGIAYSTTDGWVRR